MGGRNEFQVEETMRDMYHITYDSFKQQRGSRLGCLVGIMVVFLCISDSFFAVDNKHYVTCRLSFGSSASTWPEGLVGWLY